MIDEVQYLREGLAKRDAEIERLRAALEEIKAMCNRGESHTWIRQIVRKAHYTEDQF